MIHTPKNYQKLLYIDIQISTNKMFWGSFFCPKDLLTGQQSCLGTNDRTPVQIHITLEVGNSSEPKYITFRTPYLIHFSGAPFLILVVFSPPTQPSWKICEFVNLDHETSGGFGCENDKLFETTWNTSEILRSKNQKPRGFLLVLSAGGFLCLHTQRWPLRCWAALETGRSYPGATADSETWLEKRLETTGISTRGCVCWPLSSHSNKKGHQENDVCEIKVQHE